MTSGGGFDNPIVAGEQLLIPAIQSPNYVPGTSGWTINKDGSVEFNNGTFRGTVIVGPTGAPAVLIYDGAPAAGNLILAMSGFDGTDSFGNKFWAGLSFIHGTSPTGSRGRVSFGINDANVNDSGMILSYVDAFLNPHLISEGPGNGISLDLGVHTAFLGGPNGNQIEVDDNGNAIFLTSLNSMQLQALGVGGIMLGSNGTAFGNLEFGSFTSAFAGVNSTSGTLTFPHAFGSSPFPLGTTLVGANNDILLNWQSISASQVGWRLFQKGGLNVTTTVTVFWLAIGS